MEPTIRVRTAIAVIENNCILLVPHFETDAAAVAWLLPGGAVRFGESLTEAAQREFQEETGLQVEVADLLDVSETVLPERPWHSVTIVFSGQIVGGDLSAEKHAQYGLKEPRWFSQSELAEVFHYPAPAIARAFARVHQVAPKD